MTDSRFWAAYLKLVDEAFYELTTPAVPHTHDDVDDGREDRMLALIFGGDYVPPPRCAACDAQAEATEELDLPIADGYALILRVGHHSDWASLWLRHPAAGEPVEIASTYHQPEHNPNVLRWAELDLLGRCLALTYPELPHPGLPIALLGPFAPITVTDDADVAVALLRSALRSVFAAADTTSPASEAEVDRQPPAGWAADAVATCVRNTDARAAGFAWQDVPAMGWQLYQPDRSTIAARHRDNARFPHAAWNALIAAAHRRYRTAVDPDWLAPDTVLALAHRMLDTGAIADAPALAAALRDAGCTHPGILGALTAPASPAGACWAIELLLDAEPGSLIRRHFGPTDQRVEYKVRASVVFPTAELSEEAMVAQGAAVAEALDAAVRRQGLGAVTRHELSGASYSAGQLIARHYDIGVTVLDDFDAGSTVIRDVLAAMQAPSGTIVCGAGRRWQIA